MSLLNAIPRQEPSSESRAADSIRRSAKTMTDRLLKTLNAGLRDIWDAEDPAAVLAELGTDAEEAFLLSSETVKLFAAILPGSRDTELAELLAKVEAIPAFTINSDGTVTLD